MATVDDLRLKILDREQVVIGERLGTGDGKNRVFKVKHTPIMKGTVRFYLDNDEYQGPIDSLDYGTGKLTFYREPADGVMVMIDYQFAAFTDKELQKFLDNSNGNLALASAATLEALIADRARLITWSRGDMKIDYDAQGNSETWGIKTDEVDWEDVV